MADDKKRVVRRVKANTGASSKKSENVSRKISAKAENSEAKKQTKFVKDASGRQVSEKMAKKLAAKNQKKAKNSNKKHFWAVAWIFAIGRYFRESWRELRAVEWTNRRATWALTFAVLAFTAFFAIFVLLFDWLFQLVIKNVIL